MYAGNGPTLLLLGIKGECWRPNNLPDRSIVGRLPTTNRKPQRRVCNRPQLLCIVFVTHHLSQTGSSSAHDSAGPAQHRVADGLGSDRVQEVIVIVILAGRRVGAWGSVALRVLTRCTLHSLCSSLVFWLCTSEHLSVLCCPQHPACQTLMSESCEPHTRTARKTLFFVMKHNLACRKRRCRGSTSLRVAMRSGSQPAVIAACGSVLCRSCSCVGGEQASRQSHVHCFGCMCARGLDRTHAT